MSSIMSLWDEQAWEAERVRADMSWLIPFEDNTLEHKTEIVFEYIPSQSGYSPDDWAWEEKIHLNLCRQLAGGN